MTVEARKGQAKNVYHINKLAPKDTFSITFQFLNLVKNLAVYIRKGDNTLTKLTLDTDYYVELLGGLNGVWGQVVSLIREDNLMNIMIVRAIPNNQTIMFSSRTATATHFEEGMDKLTMLQQDLDFKDRVLRVPDDEVVEDSALCLPPVALRRNMFLAFDKDGKVVMQAPIGGGCLEQVSVANVQYVAGENIYIASDGVISAVDTIYTAGNNISIDENNVISSTDTKYELPVATETTLGGVKQGDNVVIDDDGKLSVVNVGYELPLATSDVLGGIRLGENLIADPNTGIVSAVDTKYQAGNGISIEGNVISAKSVVCHVSVLHESEWVLSGNFWTQTKVVSGVLATDKPIVNVDFLGVRLADSVEDVERLKSNWNKVFRIATDVDSIEFWATEKPDNNISINILLMR